MTKDDKKKEEKKLRKKVIRIIQKLSWKMCVLKQEDVRKAKKKKEKTSKIYFCFWAP